MPTTIFQTGFEHGVATHTSGETLYTNINGTPAVSTTIVHGGTYSMRYNASGSSVHHQSSFTSNTTIVGVCYVYVDTITMTTGNVRDIMEFHQGSAAKSGLQVRRSAGGTYAWRWNGTNGDNMTTGAWTRFDFKTVISGGNITTDWSINGTAQTQNSSTTTLTAIDGIRWGSFMGGTDAADIYWDDIILSATAGDFPIGDGIVRAVQLNNLDMSSSSDTGKFSINTGSLSSASFSLLNHIPMNSSTDRIYQNAINTAAYLVLETSDISSSTIWGATAYTAMYGGGTAAKYVAKIRRSDGTETDIVNASINEPASSYYINKILVPPPTGGWTNAEFNNLTFRIGYSDDVTPVPEYRGLLLEYSGPSLTSSTKTHTTDAVLKKTLTKTHTTDAVLQASTSTKTKTHTTDAVLTQSSNNYNSNISYTNASGVVSFGGSLWQVKPGMTAAIEQAPQGVGDGSAADRQLLLNQLTRGFAGGLVTGGNAIDTVNGSVPGWTFLVDDSGDSNTGGVLSGKPNTLHGTLRYALQLERPLWIIFSQDMTIVHGSEIAVGPDKTVDGRGRNIRIGGNQSLRYNAKNFTTSTSDPSWVPGRDNTRKANLIYAYVVFDDVWQDAQSSNAINWGGTAPEFAKQSGVAAAWTTMSTTFSSGTVFTVASTTGFPTSGQAGVGFLTFSYTGITPTSFTGCTYNSATFSAVFPSGNIAAGTIVSTYLPDPDGTGRKKTGSGDLVYIHHCEFASISDSCMGSGYVGNNLSRSTLDWSLFGPNPDQDLFDQSGGNRFCTASTTDNTFTCKDPTTNALVAHNFFEGQEVMLFTRDGYTMPGGFTAGHSNSGTGFFVRDVTTNTFRLSATRNNATSPSTPGPAATVASNGGVWVQNYDDQTGVKVPPGNIARSGDPFLSGKGPHFGVNHGDPKLPLSITGDYPGIIHASVTLCNFVSMQIRNPKANGAYLHVWNNRYYHWGYPESGSGTCGDFDDSAQAVMERNVFIPYQVGDLHNWGQYTPTHENWTVKGSAPNNAALADSGSSAHTPLIIKHTDEPWYAASARPGYNSANPSLSTYGSTSCIVSGTHSNIDPDWFVGGAVPYTYEKLTDFETINGMVATGAGNKQPWQLVSTTPTKTKTHTTDAVLKKTLTKTHLTDAVLKKTLTKTHTTDAVLQKGTIRNHTTDANLVKKTLLSHGTDAFLTTSTQKGKTHTTDAVLKKVSTISHTTDASLFKVTALSHTTDSVLLGTVHKSHTTDAILFNLRTRSHTTDAVLKDLRWWDTDFLFRRGLNITAPKTGLPLGHPFEAIFPYKNLVTMGKVREDYADLQVARFNGASWTPIPRSVIKVGSNLVISAALVAPIATQASSLEYYIYYGNSNLTGGVPSLSSYSEPQYPIIVGLTDPSLSFTHPEKDWKNGVAQVAGATATCEFEGTNIHILADTANDKGIAQVQIDNEPWKDIDLFSVTSQSSVEIFVRAGLAPTIHRLRYRMSGRRNPASLGYRVNLVSIEYKKSFTVQDRGEETPDFLEWSTSTGG